MTITFVADSFIFYSLVLLLTAGESRHRTAVNLDWPPGWGILSGLTITTRSNDGTALLVAAGDMSAGSCPEGRAHTLSACLSSRPHLTVVLFVAKLTGDSFSDYVSNSVIKAAGAKGGTGSILTAPFRLFRNALQMYSRGKTVDSSLGLSQWLRLALSIQRYWKNGIQIHRFWCSLGWLVRHLHFLRTYRRRGADFSEHSYRSSLYF